MNAAALSTSPKLPASLRASARLALDRVLQDGSEMATGWVDRADADQWRQEVRQILQALETPTDQPDLAHTYPVTSMSSCRSLCGTRQTRLNATERGGPKNRRNRLPGGRS
ncbi:DUF4259 domain-containing protein [Streptomyces sp. NPDC052092]|uniref:DUF4259 domain-containing protein n=1 Tax=Streptomyces sp. NPDC052092 TaxID=3365685 RepID=UPI0037D61589